MVPTIFLIDCVFFLFPQIQNEGNAEAEEGDEETPLHYQQEGDEETPLNY